MKTTLTKLYACWPLLVIILATVIFLNAEKPVSDKPIIETATELAQTLLAKEQVVSFSIKELPAK